MRYEYCCDKCKNRFVIEKPMSESSRDEACPICGQEARREFSAVAIRTNDGYKQSSK